MPYIISSTIYGSVNSDSCHFTYIHLLKCLRKLAVITPKVGYALFGIYGMPNHDHTHMYVPYSHIMYIQSRVNPARDPAFKNAILIKKVICCAYAYHPIFLSTTG